MADKIKCNHCGKEYEYYAPFEYDQSAEGYIVVCDECNHCDFEEIIKKEKKEAKNAK